ncbi:expressed unknown protein [Seminavis robusta]|uniref:Uncharacterized protein n=1 Tax=Seminavis robusta TaxID=568900 RepID=A0A9N8DZC1_9STRA|nr:expressed unknown protein [Seminavis robusta]|eukprot:Sro497_g154780.1 n/a (501) ;mRNA; f:31114-32616
MSNVRPGRTQATRLRPASLGGALLQKVAANNTQLMLAVIIALQVAVLFRSPPASPNQYVFSTLSPQGQRQELESQSTIKSQHHKTQQQDNKPIKVAYAISLIECTDNHKSGHSSVAGLQDASIVMRHSIHQNSIRNPSSGSKYDYQMYAIIHEQAKSCAPTLEAAGFTTIIRPPPVLEKDIQDNYLRKHIHKEVCCGVHEFVKLYAYQIPAPIVVHLDIDFIFQKPLDALFDTMLGTADKTTRALVQREDPTAPWPTNIEAMITRDYHSTYPGRNAGFQAGFWVLKPSQKHFDKLIDIIKTTNYVGDFSPQNGWGGKGYGGFVGARAMQGLIAYYYDMHVPDTWVELNNCRYNAVQAIVHAKKDGKCLSGRESCEDCRDTPIPEIYSFHYTACRKPWTCIAVKTDDPNNKMPRKYSVPVDIVHFDQCMKAQKVWHAMRADLEQKLVQLTGDKKNILRKGQSGSYNKEFFLGHCSEDQSAGYLRLAGGAPETIKRIPELYE